MSLERPFAVVCALAFMAFVLSSCHIDNPQDAQRILAGLKARGGVDIRDYAGATALINSAAYGHYYTVKLLLENGADINAVDVAGNTALMMALSGEIDASTWDENAPAFQTLSEYTRQQIKTVKLLVEHHADLGMEDYAGMTVLMHAAIARNDRAVDYLIKHGAEVNQVNKVGHTVLGVLDDLLQADIDEAIHKAVLAGDYNPSQPVQGQSLVQVQEEFQADYGPVIKVLKDAGAQ
jgi:ankyrin repeat protein